MALRVDVRLVIIGEPFFLVLHRTFVKWCYTVCSAIKRYIASTKMVLGI